MAISANAVWEVRTAGNDTNGGAFVTGASGSDYSQQDAKNTVGSDISTTDAVANGTTTITSATANFDTTIVGNVIYLQGGTGSLAATRRQVTARASTTSITVDASVAAGTGITMNIGGALSSPGEVGRNFVSGNTVHIKSGTYTITTSSGNVSGGVFSKAGNAGTIIGYDSSRNDYGTKPIITCNTTGVTMISLGASITNNLIANIAFDGASQGTSRGITGGTRLNVYKCTFANFTSGGISGTANSSFAIDCYATGCATTVAFQNISCFGCVAEGNTISGFSQNNDLFINCIAANNSGASSNGFTSASGSARCINCVAYNNGQHGFVQQSTSGVLINCIAEGNAGTGFLGTTAEGNIWSNCAAFNNGTDFNAGTGKNVTFNLITGSTSFFTNAAGDDFSLNNSAGGGADAREAGLPGAFEGFATTTSYLDIGAAQHQDSGGGGGTIASQYGFFG